MHRTFFGLLVGAVTLFCAQAPKPRLVVAITIDQFRYDYLHRFRSDYNSGLARMLERGAVFTNAHYEHFPTVTAIGHATLLSGATPSVSGIVGNEWYDRATGKQVTSVSDDDSQLLGGLPGRRGSSPHRLLVSTLADELKMANGQSRAVGISSKDRSAILPVGRMADGAYWFDINTGNFVSSTYYFGSLPEWAARFNESRVVDQWAGKQWTAFDAQEQSKPFRTLAAKGERAYYDGLDRTPFHNDLLVLFAEATIDGEKLGADEATDVLAISFSANDRIGHSYGPDSPQVRDVSVMTDRTLGRLFDMLDKKVGADNWIAVMTADHGVAPLPEVMLQRKMPAGRMPEGAVLGTIQKALTAKYGGGDWIAGKSGPAPYLDHALVREKGLELEEVQRVAAAAVRELPYVYRVYTRTDLQLGNSLEDLIDRRVRAGFHYGRSSDLFVVAQPYWLFEASGTSHGTPHNYDTHVPVIFMGPGFKPGRYHKPVAINDIAPTLSTFLDAAMPSGAHGRALHEIFQEQ